MGHSRPEASVCVCLKADMCWWGTERGWGRQWSQKTVLCCWWAAEDLRAGRGGVERGIHLDWAHTPHRCPHRAPSKGLAPLGPVHPALAFQRASSASGPPVGSALPWVENGALGWGGQGGCVPSPAGAVVVAVVMWEGPGEQSDPSTKSPPQCQKGGQG